jgi:hypothetical protein
VKKYLALILGAVFVLGFAASAFAIHAEIPAESQAVIAKGATQITIGGDVRIRGEFRKNNLTFNDDGGDHISAYDQRIRLNVNAQVTPNTQAYVEIEGASATDTFKSTGWAWGENSGSKGVYQFGDAKRGGLSVLEAWILHKGSGLLGMPAGIKVGHMALALGNKLFFDHTLFGDDAIVVFADPTKELHIGLLTIKFREGTAGLNDDADAYVGLFAYKTKEFSVSGDVVHVDHQNNTGGFPGIAGADVHLWNFGLRANANISGFELKADGELQTGKITDTGGSDPKFKGYAFMVGAGYNLDPVKLGVEYAYGSGDNDPTDTSFKTFVTSLSNVQHFTYVYDYRTTTAAGTQGTGLANTSYLKIDAGAPLAKDLSGYLAYYWLRANKVASGVSKSIGSEIDAKITYKIDRNLNYWVEGGYLFAGNFWKTVTGAKDPDDAYAVRHGIQLSF